MRSFWFDPYLWIHLAGVAALPIFLEICLLGLGIGAPLMPAWFELAFVGSIGILPILWMQWQRPFNIFSLLLLALKPTQLTDDQRRILQQFKAPANRVLAVLSAFAMAWVLWQLYGIAPLASSLTFLPSLSRGSGLLIAAIAFLASNLFLQIPISVMRVLLTRENQFAAMAPYPVEQISKDFTLIGLRVPKILPPLVLAPTKATTQKSGVKPPSAPSQPDSPDSSIPRKPKEAHSDEAAIAEAVEAINEVRADSLNHLPLTKTVEIVEEEALPDEFGEESVTEDGESFEERTIKSEEKSETTIADSPLIDSEAAVVEEITAEIITAEIITAEIVDESTIDSLEEAESFVETIEVIEVVEDEVPKEEPIFNLTPEPVSPIDATEQPTGILKNETLDETLNEIIAESIEVVPEESAEEFPPEIPPDEATTVVIEVIKLEPQSDIPPTPQHKAESIEESNQE
ncbi:MAG: low-complexity tail membrane protein [Cyanobacteria bacterium CRU_2_1]|nr:low-complexity tail membrane protein [Cyanobacteria bacterium RU_5_0]NJR61568.1 low-complexity tail membrane protein [Cyanobacteria bacterium CRU_2_1]